MVKNEMLREVLDKFEEKYGDLNDESGCSVFNDNICQYEWLSVADIVKVIEEVDEMYN